MKLADDTAVVGLISNNDESLYRREVEELVGWCNKTINVEKTKEILVNFRKITQMPHSLLIRGEVVELVTTVKYLGLYMSNCLI